jgi:DNA-binding transcriptional ArsR family regulator
MSKGNDGVFSAIADPTRRQLIEWIQESGASTATELSRRLPITRQAVTKHLRELESVGLLASKRSGRETRYEYQEGGLVDIADWIREREQAWKRTLLRLKDHTEALDNRFDTA